MKNITQCKIIIVDLREDHITKLAADYFGIKQEEVKLQHRKVIKTILKSGWEERKINE